MASEPPDYSGQYNTQLSPQEEQQFQAWARSVGKERDVYDYDLRGLWKAQRGRLAANGHGPDTYKKPNHPTFSEESQYSNALLKGGRWDDAGKSWLFWASQQNMDNMGMNALSDYFKQREPGSTVIFPINYNLPRGR